LSFATILLNRVETREVQNCAYTEKRLVVVYDAVGSSAVDAVVADPKEKLNFVKEI